MEAMRQSWTDERPDDFRGEVNRRFDEVDRRLDKVDKRFGQVDERFDQVKHELNRVNDRLDSIGRAIIFSAFTLAGAMLAGYAAMIALFATQF